MIAHSLTDLHEYGITSCRAANFGSDTSQALTLILGCIGTGNEKLDINNIDCSDPSRVGAKLQRLGLPSSATLTVYTSLSRSILLLAEFITTEMLSGVVKALMRAM